MAYAPSENLSGVVAFTNIDTSANRTVAVGTYIRGSDPTLGGGEFVYAAGVASNVVGALATWNPVAKTTTLVTNSASLGWPVAVSMTANTTTTSYSWYQVSGVASIKKTATVAAIAHKIAISATAGSVLAGSTAGKMLLNALTVNSTVSAATYLQALINRPCMTATAT